MKAKLVKYPFNEKKYRWDTYAQEKEFEYYWDKSAPKDYDTIYPYVEVEEYDAEKHKNYKVIDFGKDPGEHYYFEKSLDDLSQDAAHFSYAMTYLPEQQKEVEHQQRAYIHLTKQERGDSSDYWFPEDSRHRVNSIYYSLDYSLVEKDGKTTIKPTVKFYKDMSAVYYDGKTLNDVAVFNTNWNIAYLFGLQIQHSRVWDGPYDEPQENYFIRTTSTYNYYTGKYENPTFYYDGLEFKTNDNKYYYLLGGISRALMIDVRWGPNRTWYTYGGGEACLRSKSIDTLLEQTPDNSYSYTYSEGRTGTVNEYNDYTQIDDNSTQLRLSTIYRYKDEFDATANYDNLLPPDYENGDFVGLYIYGEKQDFCINHDYSIPLSREANCWSWYGPTALKYYAEMICRYVFNKPYSYRMWNNYDFHPTTYTDITKQLEIPEDNVIYESLCHYRTNETVELGNLYDVEDIRFYTPNNKEYLYKDRVFVYDFDDRENNVPGRDWFVSQFSTDYTFPDEHAVDPMKDYLLFPLVDNYMGWDRSYSTHLKSPTNLWYSDDLVKIVAKSTSTIMPRFKTKTYVDELVNEWKGSCNVGSNLANNEYPVSVYSNNIKEIMFNEIKVLFDSGKQEQVNKQLELSFSNTTANLTPRGYYEYSEPIYDKNGNNRVSFTASTDVYWSLIRRWFSSIGDYIDFSKPIIATGEDIDMVLWTYASEDTDSGYGYGLEGKFDAGWGQVSFQNKGPNSDFLYWRALGLNDIKYIYNDIFLINPSDVEYGIFDYLDLDLSKAKIGKYSTVNKVVPKTNLVFIQDGQDRLLNTEQGTYYSYTIGNITNNSFITKTLYTNAPCEYGYVSHQDLYNFKVDGNEPLKIYEYSDFIESIMNSLSPEPSYDFYGKRYTLQPNTIYTITLPIESFSERNINDVWEALNEWIDFYEPDRSLIPNTYETLEVISKTWLTFNSYTANEWKNGYHFEGENWNCISSPYCYAGNITDSEGSRYFYFTDKQPAPSGLYYNALDMYNNFVVDDSLGNHITSSADNIKEVYNSLNGGIFIFDSIVSSTNRHEYPDNEYMDGFIYRLRPQDTKFLRYYRSRNTLKNVELISDRYHYTHDTVDFCDRSWEGRTIGTTTSTNEESVPDGTWREYLGLYLGTSIPFLGIVETEIPPADILGVPQYDKQVNTSDTLKYGTVASASLTFTLNKPVGETLTHNNELLILYYDFKHRDEWERLGFFRVDSIEALDENTTSLMAHDEVYKLNKYVDDFLEDYTQTTTLDLFYRDLLNYCGCFYDTHQDIIHNGTLGMTNVYHAVKTTGVQVAHYVANLSPGFIHANIDGDVVLSQYQLKDDNLTIADYTNLVYTAYNTDMLNKIKIVSSNTVKGEDRGTGTNVYFLSDNPLLSELQATSYFNELAQDILEVYDDIPTYRPATVDFLIIPRELKIGDIVNLTTPKNETYKVIVMAMTISSSGVQIKSFGTQSFPVEAESNSEFVNLINDMGEISGDVSNMLEAQKTMANAIAENTEHIGTNTADITAIKQKNTQQDTAIGTNSTNISNLTNTVNGYKSTTSNNLASIILSNTVNNVALKGYVDGVGSSTLASAKSYTDSLIGTSIGMKFGTFRWSTASATTATNSVHCMYIGTNDKRNGIFIPTAFVADDYNRTYMFRVYNGSYFKLYDDDPSRGDVGWFAIGNVSFTED